MSARRFSEEYCRYALKGVIALPSAIFRPGKVVPNILFSVVVVCFHDLFFLFSAISSSLSLSLWPSEPQLSAVLPFEVPLFLVVDAESGYPVGDEKEKEHCLLYNSCIFFMYPLSR